MIKEMSEVYAFIEKHEGGEEVKSFLKEHHKKIADVEAKDRILKKAEEDRDALKIQVETLTSEKGKLQELVDSSKKGETVEVKELRQELGILREDFTKEKNLRIELETKNKTMEQRTSILDVFQNAGLKDDYREVVESRIDNGKITFEDGKLVIGDKVGDVALEHIKTESNHWFGEGKGNGSNPTGDNPPADNGTGDQYDGMSVSDLLMAGMPK